MLRIKKQKKHFVSERRMSMAYDGKHLRECGNNVGKNF